MLQKLGERIAECLECAQEAERRSSASSDLVLQADNDRIAQGWRQLARSYEFVDSLQRFLVDGETQRLAAIEQTVPTHVPQSREHAADAGPEHDLKSILDLTPFLLTRCSSDMRYLFVSESYARMIRRNADEVIGRRIVDVMGEEGFRTILPHVRRVLQGERTEYEAYVELEGVGSRYYRVIYMPERNSRAEVQGWVASIIDFSEQKRAESRIAADLRAMTLLRDIGAECVREGPVTDRCLKLILDAAIEIMGAEKGTMQLLEGTPDALVIAVQRGFEKPFLTFFERVSNDHCACGAAMQSSKQVVVENILKSDIFRGQASQNVLIEAGVRAVISAPLMSSKNTLLGMISTHFIEPHHPAERELHLLHLLTRQAADYLERKQAEQIQNMLVREVQHRSNNLLALVQSISHRSLSGSPGLAEAKSAFEGRLMALARANRELVEVNWAGVSLSRILKLNLEPFGEQAAIEGVDIILRPKDGQNFSLAVHELTTRA